MQNAVIINAKKLQNCVVLYSLPSSVMAYFQRKVEVYMCHLKQIVTACDPEKNLQDSK